MRAKNQKHAEYEIAKTIAENLGGLLPPRCSTEGGLISPEWGKSHEDKHAFDRVRKAANKIRNELLGKMERLRKHLPEDHVDYEGKEEKTNEDN